MVSKSSNSVIDNTYNIKYFSETIRLTQEIIESYKREYKAIDTNDYTGKQKSSRIH